MHDAEPEIYTRRGFHCRGIPVGNDNVGNSVQPVNNRALAANAFVHETNDNLKKLRDFCVKEEMVVPTTVAAMLIFCRNVSTEGTPIRHALETILRKNFPFMALQNISNQTKQ